MRRFESHAQRLGFFTEEISTSFSGAEIMEIMGNTNLTSDQKCRKLFDRSEDYISHVQWLCYRSNASFIDYLLEHNYITENMRQKYDDSPR